MNREIYIKACLKEVDNYDILEKNRIQLIEQIMEIEKIYDEDINLVEELGAPKDFVEELFTLNNIERRKYRRNIIREIGSILIGLSILAIGIGIIFDYNMRYIIGGIVFAFALVQIIMILATILKERFNLPKIIVHSILTIIAVRVGMALFEIKYHHIFHNYFNTFIGIIIVLIAIRIIVGIFQKKDYIVKRSRIKKNKNFHHQGRPNPKHFHDKNNNQENIVEIEKDNLKITNFASKRNIVLRDEKVNYINADIISSKVILDFQEFKFLEGDITLNLNAIASKIIIYVKKDTKIINTSDSIASKDIDFTKESEEVKYKIFLIGDMAMSKVIIEN